MSHALFERSRWFVVAVVAPGLMAGCAIGPNFREPSSPSVAGFTRAPLPAATESPLQTFRLNGPVASHWWTLFGSSELNALEDEALKANPDLGAAEASLRQARELYLAQRGTLLPSIDFGGNSTRAKNSETIAPLLANNANSYTLYQTQLSLSYDLDVFGGLKRQVESVRAQAEIQRFQTEAAYLSLTTNVANAVIQLAGLQAQLEASEHIVSADRRTLDLTRRNEALGQLAMTDVAAAVTQLDQAEQLLPPLRKQIEQQGDMLAALIGRPSAEAPADKIELSDLTLPHELPVSLPSNLVRQRPDVLAAEANLHAASAQVGVAIAARLPDFALTGQLGGASGVLGSLLSSHNIFWNVAGGVAQKVFDAGQLRHKQRAAEAGLDQAKEQYRSAVLNALRSTADVLQSIVEDAKAARYATAADAASMRSLRLAHDRMVEGEMGIFPLLSAQAAFDQAEVTLAQARTARYADTVALFQALGGGWWNDPKRNADVAR